MMFKKIAFAAPLAVLALSSSMAFAATEARHSINLIAHVPSDDFYAVPVDYDLVNKDQDMSYDPGTDSMRTVDGHFDVLHTAGKVNARLEGVPKLIAGTRLVLTDSAVQWLALPTDLAAWSRLTRLLSIGKRRAPKPAQPLSFSAAAGMVACCTWASSTGRLLRVRRCRRRRRRWLRYRRSRPRRPAISPGRATGIATSAPVR